MRSRTLQTLLLTVLATTSHAFATQPAQPTTAEVQPRPDVGSGILYEANVRVMSPEGTFNGLRERLSKLVDLNVRVLWLMPIHPVGQANRVGDLGSPYSVADYRAIDPALGTEEDLVQLVRAAHARKMLVILDWVPNHTAWDNVWTTDHPDRYVRDEEGQFVPPRPEWADVIKLDYDNPETGEAMIDAMRYWVDRFGIDGFRCDFAEGVPAEFWTNAIETLREDKQLFMFAEGHKPWLAEAGFDALFGWGLGDAVLGIVQGEGGAERVKDYLDKWVVPLSQLPHRPFRVHFTSNHDWNAWEGPAVERFGPAWDAATVLTYTLPGMAMIYSGQEAGLDRRLGFFEKDTIEWGESESLDLYQKLGALKSRNSALHQGDPRASYTPINLGDPSRVIAFTRRAGRDMILVAVNLSGDPVELRARRINKPMTDLDGNPATLPGSLEPWGWVILQQGQG